MVDYNYAVLLPITAAGDVAKTDAGMKGYLESSLKVVEGANDSIDYNWNANGLAGARVADVQAVYDFMSKTSSQLTWGPADNLLILADVLTYGGGNYANRSTARDGQITSADVDAFLYAYAYFPLPQPTTP